MIGDLNKLSIRVLDDALPLAMTLSSEVGWLFRGQQNYEWELIPAAGRSKHFLWPNSSTRSKSPFSRESPPRDLGRFHEWCHFAEGYDVKLPRNPFRRLALAQHYGFPTRLLDFTENILVALYFATESDFSVDGSVYAYMPDGRVNIEKADIYSLDKMAAVRIPPFDRRMLQQSAWFVYCPSPSDAIAQEPLPLDHHFRKYKTQIDVNLIKFRIPSGSKALIQKQLLDVGTSRKSLFPDLDGLSKYFVQKNRIADALGE